MIDIRFSRIKLILVIISVFLFLYFIVLSDSSVETGGELKFDLSHDGSLPENQPEHLHNKLRIAIEDIKVRPNEDTDKNDEDVDDIDNRDKEAETDLLIREAMEQANINNTVSKNFTLLCIVHTTHARLKRQMNVLYEAWAKFCDHTLFVCNCKDFNENNVVHVDSLETDSVLPDRLLQAISQTYSVDYRWFLTTNDDTFIFMHNLAGFISNKNPYVSQAFSNYRNISSDGVVSGSHLYLYPSLHSGILFSHESYKCLYHNTLNGLCTDKSDNGDVAIGNCMLLSAIQMQVSYDQLGKQLFNPLNFDRTRSTTYYNNEIISYANVGNDDMAYLASIM